MYVYKCADIYTQTCICMHDFVYIYICMCVHGQKHTRNNALRHTVTQCNTLLAQCNTRQHTATHYIHGNTRQHTATHCNTLLHTAAHGSTQQHTATYCNCSTLQLQHTATATRCSCNTLQTQHTAVSTRKIRVLVCVYEHVDEFPCTPIHTTRNTSMHPNTPILHTHTHTHSTY